MFNPLHNHSSPEAFKQIPNCHPELSHFQNWKSQNVWGFRLQRTLFFQGTYDSKSKYTEDDIINMLVFLIKNSNFRGLRGEGFPTKSRHSNGQQLCSSPSRHISVLIRSGIHTVFALG